MDCTWNIVSFLSSNYLFLLSFNCYPILSRNYHERSNTSFDHFNLFTLSLALTVTGVISLIIGNLKKRNDIIKHGVFKAALGIAILIIIKLCF